MKSKPPSIRILTVRDQKVVLDVELARVYGVSTKALNQAVRRNKKRFPADFAFQLSTEDYEAVPSQIVTASSGEHLMQSQIVTGSRRNIRYRPWVFTEQGAL
jgi:ORF6N domain